MSLCGGVCPNWEVFLEKDVIDAGMFNVNTGSAVEDASSVFHVSVVGQGQWTSLIERKDFVELGLSNMALRGAKGNRAFAGIHSLQFVRCGVDTAYVKAVGHEGLHDESGRHVLWSRMDHVVVEDCVIHCRMVV